MDETSSTRWENTACPLCDAEAATRLWRAPDRLYRRPGEFQLVRCGRCRHVYLNPRPTPDSMAYFYPDDYGPHHLLESKITGKTSSEESPNERTPWYLSEIVRKIPGLRRSYYWLKDSQAEYLPNPCQTGGRALEIGCGDGAFLEQLRARGWEAQGIEPAEKPARVAQSRGFEIHVGTLQPNLFPAASFDAVFAWMVVEHLHDPRAVLCEVHRILKPSGCLAVSVPNFACWEPRVFGTYWYALQLPTHLHQFTPRTIRMLLEQSGFDRIRLIHQRNVFNILGSIGLWLERAVPRLELGRRMIQFTDYPTMWGELALAPCAKLLAWTRQAGRLTIIAKPSG